jgi:hypothetical protein
MADLSVEGYQRRDNPLVFSKPFHAGLPSAACQVLNELGLRRRGRIIAAFYVTLSGARAPIFDGLQATRARSFAAKTSDGALTNQIAFKLGSRGENGDPGHAVASQIAHAMFDERARTYATCRAGHAAPGKHPRRWGVEQTEATTKWPKVRTVVFQH